MKQHTHGFHIPDPLASLGAPSTDIYLFTFIACLSSPMEYKHSRMAINVVTSHTQDLECSGVRCMLGCEGLSVHRLEGSVTRKFALCFC